MATLARETLSLTAPDGFVLKASHFPACPPVSTPSVPAVLIAPATGVPGSFYQSFSVYLASLGAPVVVIDYRYAGQSFPAGVDPKDRTQTTQALIDGAAANIDREWKMDMESGLRWVIGRYVEMGVVVVGHPVGGHLMPLMDPLLLKHVKRSLWVGAMSPWDGNYPNVEERRIRRRGILEETTKLGYFPGRKFAFGDNLTAGAGRQWFGWAQHPTYHAHDHAAVMSKLAVPVVSLAFTDDVLTGGNVENTDSILRSCSSCPSTRINFDPVKMGWPAVGHVNAFAPTHAGQANEGGVWGVMRDFILFGIVRDTGGDVKELNGGAKRASRL